jgi:hypothetical protein
MPLMLAARKHTPLLWNGKVGKVGLGAAWLSKVGWGRAWLGQVGSGMEWQGRRGMVGSGRVRLG